MSSTHAMTPIAGTNGYQQQIPIDPGQPLQLSVSNASGEIRIEGSDQAGVWIVVRRADGNADHDPDIIPVTVDVDGNRISVHPDWGVAGGVAALARKIKDQLQNGLNPGDWDLSKFQLRPDLNYDIRVQVPRHLTAGSKVSAKTASGQLSISEVEAEVIAATASGRIHLKAIRGKITTNSASGAINVERVHGSLEANTASGSLTVADGEAWTALRTVSGRINIERFVMKNARLASVSGSIHADVTADNAEEYSVSTVSGSVHLDLRTPGAVTTTLASRSASGSAKVREEWVSTGRRSWTVGSGAQGPSFNVKTVSGSLKATARADASLAARNEPLPAAYAPDDHDHDHDHDEPSHPGDGAFDVNVDGVTAWAKEFAQDFKKNFASLATPPAPPEPPTRPVPPERPSAATSPIPPIPSVPPTPHDGPSAGETGAIPAQPWTWSNGSGSASPAGKSATATGQETAPIATDPPDPAVQPAPAGAPAAEAPADPVDAERLRVLEALERGEIDIDEALARLDPDDTRGV